MAEELITIEIRIRTEDDPKQLGDRIREAATQIAGKEHLEEFRVRSIPLGEKPKGPRLVE
jgi:hypothetical protein